jgi:Flp pilus assembly pilin Flp
LASFLGGRRLRLSELAAEQRGQGMVEYAFVIVLVGMVVLLAVVIIGNQTSNIFENVRTALHS